jgi:hypothetical protein
VDAAVAGQITANDEEVGVDLDYLLPRGLPVLVPSRLEAK